MKIDGACHCGAITCEAEVRPELAVICHCTDCQTFSGAPYRVSVPVTAAHFTLRGTPKTYVKIGGSGAKRVLAFCGDCGTALYSTTTDAAPERYNLRTGWIRQRAQLPPQMQGFCRSAMPWAWDIGGVRRVGDQN